MVGEQLLDERLENPLARVAFADLVALANKEGGAEKSFDVREGFIKLAKSVTANGASLGAYELHLIDDITWPTLSEIRKEVETMDTAKRTTATLFLVEDSRGAMLVLAWCHQKQH